MQCSYCRITGLSRNLPKPHYPPLIPMPKDASEKRIRFCKITARSSDDHHYVPSFVPSETELWARRGSGHCRVMQKSHAMELHHYTPNFEDLSFSHVEGCKITQKQSGCKDYRYVYPILMVDDREVSVEESDLKEMQFSLSYMHHFTEGYQYVCPKFDSEEHQNKAVNELRSKLRGRGRSSSGSVSKGYKYVYSVCDELCSMIIPAEVEEVLRSSSVDNIWLTPDRREMVIETTSGEIHLLPAQTLTSEELHENLEGKRLLPGQAGGKHAKRLMEAHKSKARLSSLSGGRISPMTSIKSKKAKKSKKMVVGNEKSLADSMTNGHQRKNSLNGSCDSVDKNSNNGNGFLSHSNSGSDLLETNTNTSDSPSGSASGTTSSRTSAERELVANGASAKSFSEKAKEFVNVMGLASCRRVIVKGPDWDEVRRAESESMWSNFEDFKEEEEGDLRQNFSTKLSGQQLQQLNVCDHLPSSNISESHMFHSAVSYIHQVATTTTNETASGSCRTSFVSARSQITSSGTTSCSSFDSCEDQSATFSFADGGLEIVEESANESVRIIPTVIEQSKDESVHVICGTSQTSKPQNNSAEVTDVTHELKESAICLNSEIEQDSSHLGVAFAKIVASKADEIVSVTASGNSKELDSKQETPKQRRHKNIDKPELKSEEAGVTANRKSPQPECKPETSKHQFHKNIANNCFELAVASATNSTVESDVYSSQTDPENVIDNSVESKSKEVASTTDKPTKTTQRIMENSSPEKDNKLKSTLVKSEIDTDQVHSKTKEKSISASKLKRSEAFDHELQNDIILSQSLNVSLVDSSGDDLTSKAFKCIEERQLLLNNTKKVKLVKIPDTLSQLTNHECSNQAKDKKCDVLPASTNSVTVDPNSTAAVPSDDSNSRTKSVEKGMTEDELFLQRENTSSMTSSTSSSVSRSRRLQFFSNNGSVAIVDEIANTAAILESNGTSVAVTGEMVLAGVSTKRQQVGHAPFRLLASEDEESERESVQSDDPQMIALQRGQSSGSSIDGVFRSSSSRTRLIDSLQTEEYNEDSDTSSTTSAAVAKIMRDRNKSFRERYRLSSYEDDDDVTTATSAGTGNDDNADSVRSAVVASPLFDRRTIDTKLKSTSKSLASADDVDDDDDNLTNDDSTTTHPCSPVTLTPANTSGAPEFHYSSNVVAERAKSMQADGYTPALRLRDIIDQYVVIADYTPDSTQVGSIALREGQIVEVLDSNNSLRWMVRTRPSKYLSPRQGWIPSTYLERKTAETTLRSLQNIMDLEYEIRSDSKEREAAQKRRGVVKELVETEEEFVKDMQHVVNTYLNELDNPRLPKELRDQREAIFLNFKQICDFHNNVLIKGVQYYAGEPHRLGTTFLRLERDFDMHANYCQDEPQAQALLATSPVKEFFEEYSKRIGEINKSLSDHLKLPIQRINDYQLLLKELIKYTSRLKEDCTELQKALELMLSIPQRAHDLKFINSIEGFKGNIHKLGRLLRHQDWFAITEADGRTKERYLFLFKSRIFVTKVKKLSETRSKFILKDIIRLSDVEIHEVTDDLKSFEFHHKVKGQTRYPLRLQAQTELVKDAWLKELREVNTDIAAASDLSEDGIESTREESQSPVIQEVPEEITFEPAVEPISEVIEEVVEQTEPTCKTSVKEATADKTKSKDLTAAPETQPSPPAEKELTLELDSKATTQKRKSSEKEEVSSPKVQLLDSFEEEQSTVVTEGIQSGTATPMDEFVSLASSLSEDSSVYLTANELQDATSRPRFRKSLKGATCIRGDTATLECELVSVPSATVAWLKDNVPLTEADRIQFVVKGNTQYLVVRDADHHDSGIYTCKAINGNGAASCSAQLNVQEHDSKHNHPVSPGPKPPEFTIHFKDTELLEGTSVRFLVKVRANPDANVSFTKNGKPLKQDDRIQIVIEDSGTFELSIGHVTFDDAGTYGCVAKNEFGENSISANVTVTSEKDIFQGAKKGLLQPGEEPDFKWFRDGHEIEGSERLKVLFKDEEDTLALVFQHVKPEDAGLYTCVASTSSGRIACSAELTVQGAVNLREPVAPEITAELIDSEVSVGTSAMLEVKVTGFPKPKLTWSKDGKEITIGGRYKFLHEDDETISLVIKGVTTEDAGKYTVKAKNELGEVSTSGSLLVKAAPSFKKQMVDAIVMNDQNVKFDVDIEGQPAPDVSWYKDGKIVEESERLKLTNTGSSHNLTITKVVSEDAGSYSCVASNSSGKISEFAKLTVNAPPQFLKEIKSIETREEEDVKFEVKVAGFPEPAVKWLRNGEEVMEDGNHYVIEKDDKYHTLAIHKTSRRDSGKYTVEVSNVSGSVSATGSLVVNSVPQFVKPLHNIIVKEDDTFIAFEACSSGYPKPTITWYIDSIEITESNNKFKIQEDGRQHTLLLKEATFESRGKYSCKLTNIHGEVSSECSLDVHTIPRFTEKIENLEVTENVDVSYSVKLTGNPTPNVVWTKDHQEVNVTANIKLAQAEEGVHTLTLTGVTEESAGTYQCKASNSEGDAVTISKLVVNKVTKKNKRQDSEENINKQTVRQNSKSRDNDLSNENVNDDVTRESKTSKDEQIVSVRKKKRKEKKVESFSMSSVQQSSFAYISDNGNVRMSAEFSSEVITERSSSDSSGTISEKTKDVKHEKIGDFEETLKIMEMNDDEFLSQKETEETVDKIKEGIITETPEATVSAKTDKNENETSGTFTRRQTGQGEPPEDAGLTISEVIDDIEPSPDENTSGNVKKYVVKDKTKSDDDIEKEPADEESKPKAAPENGTDVDDEGRIRKRINILEEEEFYNEVIEEQWIEKSIEKEDENNKKDKKNQESAVDKQVLSKNKRNETTDLSRDGQDSEKSVKEPESNDKMSKGDGRSSINQTDLSRDGQETDKSVNGPKPNDAMLNGVGRSPTSGCKLDDEDISKKVLGKDGKENGTKATVDDNSAHPRFEGEMQTIEIWNGEPGTLEAVGISIPYPEVKWFKDGEQLMDTKEIKMTDEGKIHRLHIKKTVPEDSGTYKIELSNKIGTASQEAKIRIKASTEAKMPVIMKKLEDVVLIEGSHAIYEAKIFANPAAVTQWYKDDHPIIEGEHYEVSENAIKHTYKLVIKNATYKDVGKYTLTATNSNGEVSTEAALDVQVKPVIQEIKDKKAMPESSVYFETKITGKPTPSVKWVKGTTDLVANDKISFESDPESGTYRLNLKKLVPEDSGQYSVVAENVADTAKVPFNLTVTTEAPKFIKGLQNIGGKLNSPLKLEVHVYGLPMPAVKWFADNVELFDSLNVKLEQIDERNFSLTILQFTDEFSATYKCKAINQAGEAVSTGIVSLTKGLPEFLKKLPKELCIIDGEPINLEAKLDNNPMPKITWQKDGKEITPDERVHIEQQPNGACRLSIENGVPEDKGRYSLVATNDAGQTASTGQVVVEAVPKPPSFLKKLDNADVPQGTTLKLSAKVTAHPRPVAKWLKNGKPLKLEQRTRLIEDQGGNFGLEIDDVKPEDEGKYTLQVSNHQGEVSSDSNVTVKTSATPPDFASPLKSANAIEGAPSRLEAKVRGSPSTYKWHKDGVPFTPDETRVKSVSRPDGTVALLFEKTKPSDAGKYTLEAANPNGNVKSDADLNVQPRDRSDIGKKAPKFITPISALTADEGKPFKLQAQVAGNPFPDITWLRDDQPLKMSDVRFFNCDGDKISLELKKSSPKDGGVYTCKLSNSEGDASSEAKVAINKLYSSPNFTQRFTDSFTIPGGDPRFIGRVSGVPKPDISWYFNDQPIFDSPKYKIRRDDDLCALQIKGATAADKGRYTCRASNDAGGDACSAALDITDIADKKDRADPPSFLKKLGDCSAIEGMAGKFTACVAGFPEPTFKWYKDGREIIKDPTDRVQIQVEPHGLLRLVVKNAKPQDLGKYTLKISNPHGETESSAQLIFDNYEDKAPRERMADLNIDHDKFRRSAIPFALPDKPIISKMTDRRLTLSWKPYLPVGPGMPVTYIVDMCEVSNGDWFSARQGIRGCCCEIRNLEPFRDYKFRVRVENKYGVSDPSPFATAYRPKLEMTPPRQLPRLPPEIDFRPETSVYFPKDYDIDRPLHEEYAHAPRFLRPQEDTQYGARGEPTSVEWWVYGYPIPDVKFNFNDIPIENRERYEWAAARNGQCKLYITIMTEKDVGIYECIAKNEHGEARQRNRLAIAEHPEFIMHLDEENIMLRQSGTLQCRVIGAPYPEIKWFKDWHPIVASNRIKIEWKEPDLCTLTISDSIHKDAGLYSCVARNIGGTATSSAMVHIEEDANDYSYLKYSHSRVVRAHQRPFEDSYDIGDEIGRGTQGTVYHAVERSTGNSYAAKVMHVRSDTMPYARRELDIMNQLHDRHLVRARDAFETKNSVTLVTDLAAGGELFDTICKQTTITESEIANYIRQILWGLEHMHSKGIGHLGLTPGDILLSKPGGDDIKICDFGLSSRIIKGKDYFLNFGMPEFVAPEVVHLRPVTFATDMWSVGVITYLLLSGISPFLGDTDRETLKRIQKGQLTFDSNIFTNVSDEAKDFLSKLLVFDSEGRMDVKSSLKHPWLRYADRIGSGNVYSTDRLRDYYKRYRDWVRNSACHRFYRRRPLSFPFDHPSGMLYPPGEDYTPPSSPEASPAKTKPSWDKKPHLIEEPAVEKPTYTDRVESREHEDINHDLGYADSNSQYQNGPDTYLLQLRDVGFPLRLRQYMRLSAACSPTLAVRLHDNLSGQIVTVRERRRFTDVMDEEIDDEKKGQLDGVRRRINSEISPRSETKNRIKELLPRSRENERPPFFLEKLQDTPLIEGEPVELSCLVIGEPKPTITWYRNDVLMSESHRVKIEEDAKGRCIIKFGPAKGFDSGVYKVVARNPAGEIACRARLKVGDTPGKPEGLEFPQISDSEVLITWHPPKYDGNSSIAAYNLEYKEIEEAVWHLVANNIDHRFMVIRNMKPTSQYHFRVRAMNRFGWGDFSNVSETITTGDAGSPKIQISRAMKHQQEATESGRSTVISERRHSIDYSIELEPIQLSTGSATDKYQFVSELSRGRFSVVVKCSRKDGEQEVFAGKLLEYTAATEEQVQNEYDIFRKLRHERIPLLHEAFRQNDVLVLIQEKLQGYDILTYLTRNQEYTEDSVARAITQVLDALEYLHFRSIVHLDVQPDNVVVSNLSSGHIKLVDFGSAQVLSKYIPTKAEKRDNLDYLAPELVSRADVSPQSDVWSVGVLMYILLSGVSPFVGENQKETTENIMYVRYRFEHIYKEVTPEATRFLMAIFKKTPQKRPTADECLELKWLNPSEFILKKRERSVFQSSKLQAFAEEYHKQRQNVATKSENLLNAFGTHFSRSVSVEYDTLTTF